MGEITKTDVAELVGSLKALYEIEGDACGRATPQQMSLLVARLQDMTQQVKEAAARHGLVKEWRDWWTGEIRSAGDKHNPQFALDMANWEMRLGHYRRVLEAVPADQATTREGCRKIYRMVTGPLLDGIWYEILPGIVLNAEEKARMAAGEGHPQVDVTTRVAGQDHPGGHSNAKPPDLISPFTLGNQVLVWKEHQDERARLFWQDLKDGLPKPRPPRGLGDWLLAAGIAVVGLTTLGVGIAMYRRRRRSAPELASREETPDEVVE